MKKLVQIILPLLAGILGQALWQRYSASSYTTPADSHFGLSDFDSLGNMATYDQFILFGDSLLQHSTNQDRGFGLTPALQAEFVRRLDVVNRGFSGYNTDQALQVLPLIMPRPENTRVRFLIIFFGANDSCLKGAAGSQHVPLERFKKNLAEIINHPSVQRQKPRIILISTPPMNEYVAEENDRLKGYMEPRRKASHTALYAEAARQVAREENVALLDLWDIFMRYAGYEDGARVLPGSRELPPSPLLRILLHDGLHFTNVAYTMLFTEIIRTIEKTWPDQMPEKLPFVLPAWNDEKAWPLKA